MQILHNETEIKKVKVELAACGRRVAKEQAEKSTVREVVPPGPVSRQVLPSHDRAQKLYSTVVIKDTEVNHRLSLRSKNQPPPILSRK